MSSQAASQIPLVNLSRQYDSLRDEMTAAIGEVLESKAFILGPFVEKFEREFASYHEAAHAIGCSSGTSAISLIFEALGVVAGDEVITVGHTFAASGGAVRNVGAVPVFIDIEEKAYGLDAACIEAAITSRTKAIMPVHIYGTPCDMDAIGEIARKHNLFVVEDAAQGHGATYKGRKIGGIGIAASFSFYPGKNLGAYGDAGAITTNDAVLAEKIRKLRDHGRMSKYTHDIIGYNHRMDGIQAAVLSAKLKHLPAWTERRRALAGCYHSAFRSLGFKTVEPPKDVTSVYHLYVVEVSNREAIRHALGAAGIATGVHYPVPLHKQPAFAPWSHGVSLPVTERIVDRIISLPICADLSDEEQTKVIATFVGVARP